MANMWIDNEFMSEPQIKAYIKKMKNENAELNKALDKAIKLIVKAVEYNEGTCILGDGDCPVANGLCTSLSNKYKCEQEECWREYFTKDNGGESNEID